MAVFMALCKRQQQGVNMIKQTTRQDKFQLTPGEREIAHKLYISEMTVRATLRSVCGKVNIHSKMKLSLKEF